MLTPEEKIEVDKQINIAFFAVTVLTLACWIGLLLRMLILKDTYKLNTLIVI